MPRLKTVVEAGTAGRLAVVEPKQPVAAVGCPGLLTRKVRPRRRSLTMRRSLLTITILATLSSVGSAANTGQNFYGYWQWKAVVIPAHDTRFVTPTDACRQAVQDLGFQQGDPGAGFLGIVKDPDFTDNNNFWCKWKHSDGSVQTTNDIEAEYFCPLNASVVSIKNPGAAADKRCHCDTGPCYTSSPPSYDTSERCVGPGSKKLEPATPVSSDPTPKWSKLLNRFKQQYKDAIHELPDPKECHFDASDLWPNPDQATVNIGYLCGFRAGDERAANAVANLKKADYAGEYTWHHDLNKMGEMTLVKTTAHDACKHSGGGAAWAQMFGWPKYPNNLPPLK